MILASGARGPGFMAPGAHDYIQAFVSLLTYLKVLERLRRCLLIQLPFFRLLLRVSDGEYLYRCFKLFLGAHIYQFSKFLKNISQSSDFVLRYFQRIEYSYRFYRRRTKLN